MRVNVEWLRDWVDIEIDADQLAEELTTAGLEVDAVLAAGPSLEGVVVARLVELGPHPNADRLSLCTVDDGQTQHEVVCGAPNVAVGIKVPYAPIGTRLPNGQTIKAAKIRGVASQGMLCSAKELQLAEDASGLLLLDDDAQAGTKLNEYLNLDDAVLDIDLTPNRGDCFSVIGIAREVAARHESPLVGPALSAVAAQNDTALEVRLSDPDACPRFAGRVVSGISTESRTPLWMRERLRRVGLRPIHPVVDVTNYVMIELGQPLHAYNLDRIQDGIDVRFAKAGEQLTLLDEKQLSLDRDALVIADASGAIGLAGIMGGAGTSVDSTTSNIFFEAAFFAPAAILGRARRYGMHTDASIRFERGVDPAGQERAIERATKLLQQIAGGDAGPLVLTEAIQHLPQADPVQFSHSHAESLLGVTLSAADVESFLGRLDMRVSPDDELWTVQVPSFRFDIRIAEDVIEELGRMIGYDNIPVTPGKGIDRLGTATELRVNEEAALDLLVARGYSEVITYSFIDEDSESAINPGVEAVKLLNAISSEMNVLRRSLWPGLLRTAQQNLSRQQPRLRIVELGRQFAKDGENILETNVLAGLAVGSQWPEHWDQGLREVDFFDIKADLEALFKLTARVAEFEFHPAVHPALNPVQSASINFGSEKVGWLGSLHPKLQRRFDLKTNAVLFSLKTDFVFAANIPSFRPYSKYPSVRRDIAVIVNEEIGVQTLLEQVSLAAADFLQSVTVFDVYRGEGIDSRRKSVGLGLILQDASRTLTDDDADRTVQSITQRLERELGAAIRT